jgi:Sap, sulfolipid-1-addressing protein
MLAPLELPLAGFVLDTQRTEQMVTALNSFIRQHRRSGLLAACVAVGGYLVQSGVIG